MAAIRMVDGRWFAVHGTTGKKLKGQPRRGFSSRGPATSHARRVCARVMRRACPIITTFKRGR